MKHQLLYLCHTYFRVLYEIRSGTFLQQQRKVNGNEYTLSTSINQQTP